jgi:predicted dehydrogenase
MNANITRRGFLQRTALTALGGAAATLLPAKAARAARVGVGDKVRLGMIGTGGMGRAHIYALAQDSQCELVALCDCFRPRYEEVVPNVEKITGKKPDVYQDFRRVLDRDDIDAVFVVTPDHWHPLMTILACQAGKDVYVEKPACTTVEEGRAMVTAARRYGRIVQVGTQQRSMPVFQKAIDIVKSGRLGAITSAHAWISQNGQGGIETPGEVPEGLDWDMWLGPAPWTPYAPERHFGWMGWQDYARGGELTNWGIHLMDILQWGIGEDRPLSVQSLGSSPRGGAASENYEVVESLFEYKRCNATWDQRHRNIHHNRGYGIEFKGTEGYLTVDRGSFEVKPDSLGIERYEGAPERTWANSDHHHNFFDCVRTRKLPVADVEQGVRSTSTVLLAGIALKTGRKLAWDGDAERFINDDQANRFLSRTYRAPWHL